MFDELDDTETFTPGERFRTAVMRRSRSARRKRTALKVGGVTCAAAIALPAAFAFYEYRRLDDIHRISIPGVNDGLPIEPTSSTPAVSAASPSTVPIVTDPVVIDGTTVDSSTGTTQASSSGSTTPAELGSAQTFLVIGVDTNDAAGVLGARSDTPSCSSGSIPPGHRVRLLSIPRDLWVDTGNGAFNRINSLVKVNDPARLVAVIEQTMVVSIDHVVQVDFDGFQDLTDLAGGVKLISNLALRDSHTGLDLPGGQCVTLNGQQALGLVRSRHTQYYDGTKWIEDPRSDFGRIDRQQMFLRALAGGLLDSLDDPGSINDFISVATQSMVVDVGLSNRELLSTAWTMRDIGVAGMQSTVVQASPTVVGGAAVLQASDQQLADAIAFLRGDPPVGSTGSTPESTTPSTTGEPAPTGPMLQPC